MIPRIKSIQPLDIFVLLVEFDGGEKVLYDVKDDIRTLVDFRVLETKMLFVRCFYLSDAQHPPVCSHLCHETRPHHKKYFCILKKYIPLLRLSITILLSASSLFAQTPVDSLPQPDSLTAARVVAFREQIKPVPGGYAVRVADLPISKEAKAPIPYASVYLTAKNDTLITNFTLTDTTGLATIKKRPVVFTVATGIRINPGK